MCIHTGDLDFFFFFFLNDPYPNRPSRPTLYIFILSIRTSDYRYQQCTSYIVHLTIGTNRTSTSRGLIHSTESLSYFSLLYNRLGTFFDVSSLSSNSFHPLLVTSHTPSTHFSVHRHGSGIKSISLPLRRPSSNWRIPTSSSLMISLFCHRGPTQWSHVRAVFPTSSFPYVSFTMS